MPSRPWRLAWCPALQCWLPCRDGWSHLLCATLRSSLRCAELLQAYHGAALCKLELAASDSAAPPDARHSMAAGALQHLTAQNGPTSTESSAQGAAAHVHGSVAEGQQQTSGGDSSGALAATLRQLHLTGESAESSQHLQYHVAWQVLPPRPHKPPLQQPGAPTPLQQQLQDLPLKHLPDLGWLNVLNVAATVAPSGAAAGGVLAAVALRNMLPAASESSAQCALLCSVRYCTNESRLYASNVHIDLK